MDGVGVAIVGCGYWGINYVRVFSELPTTRVVAICDQRPERLSEICRRFPGVEFSTQVEDVVERDDVQAVVVCTEATNHFGITWAALEAGKHVLVEKPITTSSSEARELISLAKAKDVILMVDHTFLYNGAIRKVKSYIDQQDLGHLYYMYASRTNLGPFRRDVNAIWDLAPHDVAIFNYLLGTTPEWVSAVGAKVLHNHREDVGFITLGYPDEIVGHIHVSWADPNKVREIVVVGSNKRIVFSDTNTLEQVRVFERGVMPAPPEAEGGSEYQFQTRDGDIISPRINGGEPLKNLCLHFLDCIATGSTPLTSGEMGLAVVQVMETVDRSVKLNGVPVPVEVFPEPAVGPITYEMVTSTNVSQVLKALEFAAERKASAADPVDGGR